ncbi:hypothetical protein PMAYCL1PPCAC_26335 [Pristionchus mayeri]|uniref:SXP/RAL-2 family protein Ani s 5-like cation-binding domain-containing protein n=1 Tax=Pristionchus mayeri TaxID=1317129 RepID=A0AAN5D5N0_9BILA|nr:hypothetical protein PMAYCL1PPCAC_26335 [Pristionchus mayeri]
MRLLFLLLVLSGCAVARNYDVPDRQSSSPPLNDESIALASNNADFISSLPLSSSKSIDGLNGVDVTDRPGNDRDEGPDITSVDIRRKREISDSEFIDLEMMVIDSIGKFEFPGFQTVAALGNLVLGITNFFTKKDEKRIEAEKQLKIRQEIAKEAMRRHKEIIDGIATLSEAEKERHRVILDWFDNLSEAEKKHQRETLDGMAQMGDVVESINGTVTLITKKLETIHDAFKLFEKAQFQSQGTISTISTPRSSRANS